MLIGPLNSKEFLLGFYFFFELSGRYLYHMCNTKEKCFESSPVSPPQKQVRLVSVKAECPNHPSHGGVSQPGGGSGSQGGPPRQQRHVHESIRPIRLTVALGLMKINQENQRAYQRRDRTTSIRTRAGWLVCLQ